MGHSEDKPAMHSQPSTASVEGSPALVDQGDAEDVTLLVRRHGESTSVPLKDGGCVTIGRSSSATIPIYEVGVSRRHVEIRRSGQILLLQDHGSRNGSTINGLVVRGETQRLRGGDVVRVGNTRIVVASSHHDVRPSTVTSRLDLAFARLEAEQREAALLRVTLPARAGVTLLERMAPSLRHALAIEAKDEQEYAVLLPGDREGPSVDAIIATLGVAFPQVAISASRFPGDGSTFQSLWNGLSTACGARVRAEAVRDPAPGVVVADAAMHHVFQLVSKLAPAPTTVLILGETGVGKDVIAAQLHQQSKRVNKPFVRLNCASLPESLLESELFGHERGAFTGADRRKIGYIEAADGGTLFLDEIGELPLSAQAKLLVVLETRKVTRIGVTTEVPVDVRVLCATHRDLKAEVAKNKFRADLYYRISTFTIRVPPLRDRRSDIRLLAKHFAAQLAQRLGIDAPIVSEGARRVLDAHAWPGNIRELRNAMEHAVLMAEDGVIEAHHLPPLAPGDEAEERSEGAAESPTGRTWSRLNDQEPAIIRAALEAELWNQAAAARRLGISRRMLLYRMCRYGIAKPA